MGREKTHFQLRPAAVDDQALIRRMVFGAGLNPLSLNWEGFLLAENDEGEVIGCGQIKTHRDGSKELASIFVTPEERGNGIARAIIEDLLVGEAPPIWLTCRRELTDLYTRFGFHEIQDLDRMPIYFRRVSRLIRVFSFSQDENPLAVMCWYGS